MMALKATTFACVFLAAHSAPIKHDIDAAVMQEYVKVASEDRAEKEQLSMAETCLGDVSMMQLDLKKEADGAKVTKEHEQANENDKAQEVDVIDPATAKSAGQPDPEVKHGSKGLEGAHRQVAKKQKLMIVSAQFGRKDRHFSLPNLTAGLQGFFYTDKTIAERLMSGASTGIGWTIVNYPYHLDKKFDTHQQYSLSKCNARVRAIMSAKFYKMNAYLLPELETADLIFWTDSRWTKSFEGEDLYAQAVKAIGDADMVIGRHTHRQTVAAEIAPAVVAALAGGIPEDKVREDMSQGLAAMQKQGFHDDFGLFHCAQFLFRPRSPSIHRAMEYWWKFNQKYTYRDQISAPWAFESGGVKINSGCKGHRGAGPCVLKMILQTALQ